MNYALNRTLAEVAGPARVQSSWKPKISNALFSINAGGGKSKRKSEQWSHLVHPNRKDRLGRTNTKPSNRSWTTMNDDKEADIFPLSSFMVVHLRSTFLNVDGATPVCFVFSAVLASSADSARESSPCLARALCPCSSR
jgi:hypothetical protein